MSLLSVLLVFSCASDPVDAVARKLFGPKEGFGIDVYTIASAHIGTRYCIYVGLPDDYDETAVEYPVAIFLDGDYYFSGTIDDRRADEAAGAPEVILVGVGYGEGKDMRRRDYTPTLDREPEAPEVGSTGGAPDFLEFILDELLPDLETRYRIAPDRAGRCIAGHSLGGLFSLYALFTASDSFGLFIASSPSLYWDDLVVFKLASQWIKSDYPKDIVFFDSIGSQEASPSDLFVEAMNSYLSTEASCAVELRYYPNSTHGQVWRRAYRDGLNRLFGSSS